MDNKLGLVLVRKSKSNYLILSLYQ